MNKLLHKDKRWSWWIMAPLLVSWLFITLHRPLWRNVAALALNQAIGHSTISYPSRMANLTTISSWGGWDDTLIEKAKLEKAELLLVRNYLQETAEFSQFVPGPQLLSNPDFVTGQSGWVEYNSRWIPEYKASNDTILSFTRQGVGHGSLSQTMELTTDTCYLFSVVGSVVRRDETPTFWLYWETYEENNPIGHYISAETGNQSWGRRFGVFCLPFVTEAVQKVTVSPANLYGDATIRLDSVRFYQLMRP